MLGLSSIFGIGCSSRWSGSLGLDSTLHTKNSSGNGTSYDGMQSFLELKPGFTCEGQIAAKSVLLRNNEGKWTLIKNSLNKCAESSTLINDLNYTDRSHYQTYDDVTFNLNSLNANKVREFNVDPTADPNTPNVSSGKGVCANSVGKCSLRAAFDELNSLDLPAIINIPGGTYNLMNALRISIMSPVLVQGASNASTIINSVGDAATARGMLAIHPDWTTAAAFDRTISPTTVFQGLTFTNGSNSYPSGSAIDLEQGSVRISECQFKDHKGSYAVSASKGSNEVIVEDSIFSNNTSNVALGVAGTWGLTIIRSQFFGNRLAVDSNFVAKLDIQQSSFYNNEFALSVAACGSKCVVENTTLNNNIKGIQVTSFTSGSDSDIFIRNTTVANSTTSLEYIKFDLGRYVGAGRLFLQNSILSTAHHSVAEKSNCRFQTMGATTSNAAGRHFRAQNSLADDSSCGTNGVMIADPLLQPLALNGGSTPTMMPMTGSPVIDAGNNLTCSNKDQRELSRPIDYLRVGRGPTCDIGAVEMQ